MTVEQVEYRIELDCREPDGRSLTVSYPMSIAPPDHDAPWIESYVRSKLRDHLEAGAVADPRWPDVTLVIEGGRVQRRTISAWEEIPYA